MTAVTVIVLLVTCFSCTYTHKVYELNDRFIDIYPDGRWLVKFYAPWCGHCKKLEPVWMQVAQHAVRTGVRVGRVDCTKYTSVASHFGIRAYPTIMFLDGDQFSHVYDGDRELHDIVDYIVRMAAPPVPLLSDAATLRARQTDTPLMFIYAGSDDVTDDVTAQPALWQIYEHLVGQFRAQHSFYRTSLRVLAKFMKPTPVDPSVVLWRDGEFVLFSVDKQDQVGGDLQDQTDQQQHALEVLNTTLHEFINKGRFSRFIKVTAGNLAQVLRTRRLLVVAVTRENSIKQLDSSHLAFKQLVHSVAVNNKQLMTYEEWQFGWVSQPSVVNNLAGTDLATPSLVVFNSSDLTFFLPDDFSAAFSPSSSSPHVQPPTEQQLVDFLKAVLAGDVPAQGGDSYKMRVQRSLYQTGSALRSMWRGNPVLTTLLVGLPSGFLALICYSACCQDVMDAAAEDDIEQDDQQAPDFSYHEKHE